MLHDTCCLLAWLWMWGPASLRRCGRRDPPPCMVLDVGARHPCDGMGAVAMCVTEPFEHMIVARSPGSCISISVFISLSAKSYSSCTKQLLHEQSMRHACNSAAAVAKKISNVRFAGSAAKHVSRWCRWCPAMFKQSNYLHITTALHLVRINAR